MSILLLYNTVIDVGRGFCVIPIHDAVTYLGVTLDSELKDDSHEGTSITYVRPEGRENQPLRARLSSQVSSAHS